MEVFGFYFVDYNDYELYESGFIPEYYPVQNVLNFLGWIPIVSLFSGAARIGGTCGFCIVDPALHRGTSTPVFFVSLVRGVLEMLQLGWLFIVPDIFVTFEQNWLLAERDSAATDVIEGIVEDAVEDAVEEKLEPGKRIKRARSKFVNLLRDLNTFFTS